MTLQDLVWRYILECHITLTWCQETSLDHSRALQMKISPLLPCKSTFQHITVKAYIFCFYQHSVIHNQLHGSFLCTRGCLVITYGCLFRDTDIFPCAQKEQCSDCGMANICGIDATTITIMLCTG